VQSPAGLFSELSLPQILSYEGPLGEIFLIFFSLKPVFSPYNDVLYFSSSSSLSPDWLGPDLPGVTGKRTFPHAIFMSMPFPLAFLRLFRQRSSDASRASYFSFSALDVLED